MRQFQEFVQSLAALKQLPEEIDILTRNWEQSDVDVFLTRSGLMQLEAASKQVPASVAKRIKTAMVDTELERRTTMFDHVKELLRTKGVEGMEAANAFLKFKGLQSEGIKELIEIATSPTPDSFKPAVMMSGLAGALLWGVGVPPSLANQARGAVFDALKPARGKAKAAPKKPTLEELVFMTRPEPTPSPTPSPTPAPTSSPTPSPTPAPTPLAPDLADWWTKADNALGKLVKRDRRDEAVDQLREMLTFALTKLPKGENRDDTLAELKQKIPEFEAWAAKKTKAATPSPTPAPTPAPTITPASGSTPAPLGQPLGGNATELNLKSTQPTPAPTIGNPFGKTNTTPTAQPTPVPTPQPTQKDHTDDHGAGHTHGDSTNEPYTTRPAVEGDLPEEGEARLRQQQAQSLQQNIAEQERRQLEIAGEDPSGHLDLLGIPRGDIRSRAIVAGSEAVELTPEEQLMNDIKFDTFDYVPPGFGLGANNKIHLDNQRHEQKVRFRDPLMQPREYQFPVPIRPIPAEFQDSVPTQLINKWFQRAAKELLTEKMAESAVANRGGSTQAIPGDLNSVPTSTGKPRLRESRFMRPAYDNNDYWMPAYRYLAGAGNTKRGFRSVHDRLDIDDHPRGARSSKRSKLLTGL
jgi:hypothetical protein